MWNGFKDDYAECDWCGNVVSGEETGYVYKWRGGIYCSDVCLKEAWHEAFDAEVVEDEEGFHWRGEDFKNWNDLDDIFEEKLDSEIELKDLWTAEDKAFAYADERYEEERCKEHFG